MDHLCRHEIYIPKDAEVKRIALQSLPRSLLTGMGLPPSDSGASRKLPDSLEGIWICPAVLRPKGQKLSPDTGSSLLENMSSKLAKDSHAPPEPIQMSFVSSNRAARKVLQDTIQGVNVSADTPFTSDLPPGSAPRTYQIAVVIYQGHIYLSIRKPGRSQHQRETRAALTAAGPAAPAAPSTSDTSSSSQRKRMAPEAPSKPAGKKTEKKRLRIPLPPGSLKLKNLTKKAPAVSQELLHGSRPERIQTQSKKTQGGNNTMSKTSPLVPRPPDRVHRVDEQSQSHVGAEQTPEEAAAGEGEATNTSQNIMMDTNPQTDSRDQSWTRRESQSSSSLQQQQQQLCDFKELEQEEKIAQIKAKLRLKEAALKNLKKECFRSETLEGALE